MRNENNHGVKLKAKRAKIPVNFIVISFVCLLFVGFIYMVVGTSTRVDEIKERVPAAMAERGWQILRYEGYELGSMGNHGGKVWYHVRNTDDQSIQYRVYVTLWGGDLHFNYGEPERLNRVNVNYGLSR